VRVVSSILITRSNSKAPSQGPFLFGLEINPTCPGSRRMSGILT
jgi:hypothetical protein